MAFYVLLIKEMEDTDRVVYKFGPDERQLGLLELSKNDGQVKEIEPAPIYNSSKLFPRAAAKIYRHWKEGNFPEESEWAS